MKYVFLIITGLIILRLQDSPKKVVSVIKSPKTGDSIILSTEMDSLEIVNIANQDLRLLRNEVFARLGYTFNSQDLTSYYSQFDWYSPRFSLDQVLDKLTKIDKHNIALIKSIESYREKVEIIQNNEYQKYLELIPRIDLPINFNCGNAFAPAEIDERNGLIKKYKRKDGTIIGKLFQNETEVAVIYAYPSDVFYPIISITDTSGKELRTVRLFKLIDCTGGEGYVSNTTGVITKDLIIKTVTEITTWDSEKEGAERKKEVIENEVQIK